MSNVRVPKGWNVDEYLPRHLGGPPLLFNQHLLPVELNQYLGSLEAAALSLAAARPDAVRPCLAGSLTNLAVYLGDLGRPEDALAAIREASR